MASIRVTCAKLSAMAAQGQSWWPRDLPRGDRVFPETLPGETLIDVLLQAFHWRGCQRDLDPYAAPWTRHTHGAVIDGAMSGRGTIGIRRPLTSGSIRPRSLLVPHRGERGLQYRSPRGGNHGRERGDEIIPKGRGRRQRGGSISPKNPCWHWRFRHICDRRLGASGNGGAC